MGHRVIKVFVLSGLVTTVIILYALQSQADIFRRMSISGTRDSSRVFNPGVKQPETYAVGDRQKIVILSYMRCGSTLTGDILQQSPQVFYVYEPLWFSSKIMSGKLPSEMILVDSTEFKYPTHSLQALNLEMVHALKAFLDCRFEDIPMAVLKQWTSLKSMLMKKLYSCIGKSNSLLHIRECARAVSNICLQRPVSIAKTIRFSMQQMHALLNSDPKVKVIHLFRDPRGAMRSRKNTAQFEWNDVRNHSEKLCSDIMADVEMSKIIQAHFPGRVLSVRYEDIVASPAEAARQLYQFAGLEFTSLVEDFVWNSTYAGRPDNCNICTTRSNATETAYRWRGLKLHFRFIEIEQEACAELMEALGYRKVATLEEMLDRSIETTLPDYGDTGLARVDIRQVNQNDFR